MYMYRRSIRSRQPAKIAAYFIRIYFLPLPALSVFSLKLLKKFISLLPTLVSSDSCFKTYKKKPACRDLLNTGLLILDIYK